MREANAWRIEWNETPSIPAALAAGSKPRLVAFRCPSGRPKRDAKTGSESFEYLELSLCFAREATTSDDSGIRRTAARVFGGAYSPSRVH
jgi:hypothetical protein